MTYLGIDLGTSGVKVILLGEQQIPMATAYAALNISRLHPLWSEQNPLDWWQATEKAVQQLRVTHARELSALKAIGLSGQMHGATLLDEKLNPLRPAILWNDGRAWDECELILQRVPETPVITGNMMAPGFTAPKLLWVQKYEPSVFKKIKKILLPKDYLRLLMTGEFATDMSDASGTGWLDVGQRTWSDVMIAATEIERTQLPELFEGPAITGQVKAEIAVAWGIPKNTVVIAGAGDNAAAAISMGVVAAGNALLSLGTSGVYFVADDRYRPHAEYGIHTFCHCLPERWHEMNVHLSAASALSWLTEIMGIDDITHAVELAKQHKTKFTPLFLPHLSGERSPYRNPYARGVFFGLSLESRKNELIQSVLEGVAFLFALGQRELTAADISMQDVAVVGGGARSRYWGEIMASALNRSLLYRQESEVGAALGAAKLAWFAIQGGHPEQVLLPPALEFIVEPKADWIELYKKKINFMQKLYQQCEPLFTEFMQI